MFFHPIRHPGYLALALLLIAPQAAAIDAATLPPAAADAMAQAASPQAIAEYRRKLKEYLEARAAFDQEADAYWNSIAEKRRGRSAKRRERRTIALDDYVLTQPPVYAGPRRPVSPAPEAEEPREPRERKRIPLGAGRMGAAREARQYAAGLGDPCHGAGYRCRSAAADPQAPHLRDLRPRQGFYAPAHRG